MNKHDPIFISISQLIKDNQIVLFMKGSAEMPACGFSKFVVQILEKLQVDFKTINILEDTDLRQGIKDYSQWPTIPQLYINGEFIGGADIVKDMYHSGELFSYLDDQKISYHKPQ